MTIGDLHWVGIDSVEDLHIGGDLRDSLADGGPNVPNASSLT